MSLDPKSTTAPSPAPLPQGGKGVRIFTYPKIIFIFPTMIVSFICGIGMLLTGDNTVDPTKDLVNKQVQAAPPKAKATATAAGDVQAEVRIRRFSSTQNILGMMFMAVFAFNLLVMAIDFPRFTVIALVLLAFALTFFLLWLNVYFDLLPPLVNFLESIYAVANAQFYFLVGTIILLNLGIIWATRYLDYWVIMPNEILHNHGPFSDLERFPTFNLKFDKEIPDILEYALLRAGRIVLHVTTERKAIVLDNVLWLDHKEEELKKLMSRMEVRVTSDQEVAAEDT
jgi:hypothetical protein